MLTTLHDRNPCCIAPILTPCTNIVAVPKCIKYNDHHINQLALTLINPYLANVENMVSS